MEAYAIHDQEAATVAQKLVDDMFCQLDRPFESKLIQELCKQDGAGKILKILKKPGRLLIIFNATVLLNVLTEHCKI